MSDAAAGQAAPERRAALIFPGPVDTVSGGFEYDRRLLSALRAEGLAIEGVELAGGFPFPSDAQRAASRATLEGLPPGLTVLFDGLAACADPGLAATAARGRSLIALVHHPLADEAGLEPAQVAAFTRSEAESLALAERIIVTSAFTKRRLVTGFGATAERIDIAEPGTERRPVSHGSKGERLEILCVGSVTPRKWHLLLLEALSQATAQAGVEWRLTCAGPLDFDPDHAVRVRAQAQSFGARVRFLGPVDRDHLDRLYACSDLLVSAASYEGFGMAIAEAVSAALPVIAVAGGAVPDTSAGRAAALIPVGDANALALALSRFMTDATWREGLKSRSLAARETLPDWAETARRVQASLAQCAIGAAA